MDDSSGGVYATVVVPTFRRPDSLRRTLDGLARQQAGDLTWDVVVVDNDDPPGAAPVFETACASLPAPARLVHERRRGASHARNRGISEVRSPVTVFLDDDVVPEPDWLSRLLEPIRGGRADAVAGRVVLDPTAPRPTWFDASWHDTPFGDFQRGDQEHLLAPDDYLNTASGAVKTDLLRATGGFDPVLGPREGVPLLHDDVRLYRQLLDLGARVLYVPRAVVVHDLPAARLTRRYIVRREYFRGRSSWLSERERHATMRMAGVGAVRSQLATALKDAASDGLLRPSTLYRVAGEAAFVAGYTREAVRCLLRGRRIEPSGAWLE